jgi:hypothetical protein
MDTILEKIEAFVTGKFSTKKEKLAGFIALCIILGLVVQSCQG